MWVARFDPAGRRLPGQGNDDRYVEIGPVESGLAGIWAQLRAPDGVALDQKLDALAATVCRDDPRTKRRGIVAQHLVPAEEFGDLGQVYRHRIGHMRHLHVDRLRRPGPGIVIVAVSTAQAVRVVDA